MLSLAPYPLPARSLANAFNAFTRILKADARLRPLNIDWREPVDTNYDDGPSADRITVKFVPDIQGVEPHAIVGHGQRSDWVRLAISLEVTTNRYWADNANLWQQIEAAFYKPDDAITFQANVAALTEAGIHDLVTTALSVPLVPGRTATGSFLLTLAVPA